MKQMQDRQSISGRDFTGPADNRTLQGNGVPEPWRFDRHGLAIGS